jgi:hypothetical protein
VVPVNFTQAQVRKVLNLSPETVRHWRRVLPALARRPRRAAFSHGDLVAMAVVSELVGRVGIKVSALAPVSEAIFKSCNRKPWLALAQSRIQIELGFVAICPNRTAPSLKDGPFIAIPLGPLIDRLGRGLLGAARVPSQLLFPLLTQARRVR